MPYTIKTTGGIVVATIADQTLDTSSSSLTLFGKGSVNYGPSLAENFVYLMENFANTTPPSEPLTGQLWYDTGNALMRYYAGSGSWIALSNVGGLGNTVGLLQGTTLGGNVSGGNRIAGSIGVTLVNPHTNASTTVGLVISEGRIISLASSETIAFSSLPATVSIEGSTFSVASRFPNGVQAGVTLATDGAGYVNAGLATSSLYADVAERYEADGVFIPGQVVSFGGEKEITLTTEAEDPNVFGIVTTAPALLMNDQAGSDETHPAIALVGRVPCFVVGPVRKFALLVSAGIPGIAKAAEGAYDPRSVIGRALRAKTTMGTELLEVVVGR